jgi:hypothetical protein
MRDVRIFDLIMGMQITSMWHHVLHRTSSFSLRSFLPYFLSMREAKRIKMASYSAQTGKCLTGATNIRWTCSNFLASVDITQLYKVVSYLRLDLTAVKYKISRK